jgi:hypothetical protein
MKLCILTILICNQIVYDKIYGDILQQTLDQKLTQKSINEKNNAIETLRKLCNGQLSSYELGRKVE